MKRSTSKAFAVVLSLLLALSVCLPLSAAPRAYADGDLPSPPVDVDPELWCDTHGIAYAASEGCPLCAASAKKSTISLAAAGAPVANPVAYNVYKLFDADVQDGKACNVRYFYRTKETMGTLKVGYSHGSPKQDIVNRAMSCIGKQYQYGACSPGMMDASGFVSFCVTGQYQRLGNVAMFFNNWERTTTPEPGDICATASTCGVYIGDGMMVHGSAGKYFNTVPVQAGMVYLVAPTASTASVAALSDGASDSAEDLQSAQDDAAFIKEHIDDGSTLAGDSFGMALARSVASSYASFAVALDYSDDAPAGGVLVSPRVAAALGADSGTLTLQDEYSGTTLSVPYAVSDACGDDVFLPSRSLAEPFTPGYKGSVNILRADGSEVPVPSDVPTVKSDGVPVEVDGPGYYLIVDPDVLTGENTAASSPVFVLVGEGNTEIKEKSAIPTVTKSVKEDSTGEYGVVADATFNQSVDFRLVGTLPSNLASYEKYFYAFHDECVGFTNPDTLQVYVDGVAIDSSKYVLNVPEGGGSFDVIFSDLLSCGVPVSAASSVVVEYSARMLPITPAPNVVYVEYSNNPMNEGSHGNTTRDEVNVYAYALNFHKVDNATSEPLAGVCFTVKNAAGKYIAFDDVESTFESDEPYTWTTDAAGNIAIEGVDADTYTVEEVSTLEDYKLLKAPFDVQINASDKSAVIISVLDNPAYVSAAADAIEVRNVKTFELPNTGQLGFVGLLAAGFLVLGGTLVYEVRRRRDAEEV